MSFLLILDFHIKYVYAVFCKNIDIHYSAIYALLEVRLNKNVKENEFARLQYA